MVILQEEGITAKVTSTHRETFVPNSYLSFTEKLVDHPVNSPFPPVIKDKGRAGFPENVG